MSFFWKNLSRPFLISNLFILEKSLEELVSVLEGWFKARQKVAVAFSGGVDSSLLFFVGNKVLDRNCKGVFAKSPLMAQHQIHNVRSFCEQFGLALDEINFLPLDIPGYSENKKDRCYICKKAIYSLINESLGPSWQLVDGTNLDDNPDKRPGFKAIKELNVATPYLDCRINKKQIRDMSFALGLPTWNKPSDSCLATRIKWPNPISEDLLQKVEAVEAILHNMGFDGVRAKLYGDAVCLTFNEGDLERALILEVRKNIKKKLAECSFFKVFLDLSERRGILP